MRSTALTILLLGFWMFVPPAHADERARIDLNGTWEFRTDPQDQGDAQGWSQGTAFPRQLTVPGAWQAQAPARTQR